MLAVRSLFRSSVHDRLHWSCVARTKFAFSHSSRPCICCKAQAIRVEESALDISALSLHGQPYLIASYGATARARRGKFTLSGSGAGACANELEDEFEERCGGQKMKSRLMDGGRHMDPALKDAGARDLEGVGPIQ